MKMPHTAPPGPWDPAAVQSQLLHAAGMLLPCFPSFVCAATQGVGCDVFERVQYFLLFAMNESPVPRP